MRAAPGERSVALVGLMGSGKSALGALLAGRIGWPFRDLDADIERRAGLPIREIFARFGEARFRALEGEALRAALDGEDPLVLATGGGAVLDIANRRLLSRRCLVVWLRVEPAEAARRVGADPGRPLVAAGDPERVLRDLGRKREPFYAEIAHVVLDSREETSPEGLARALERAVPWLGNLRENTKRSR